MDIGMSPCSSPCFWTWHPNIRPTRWLSSGRNKASKFSFKNLVQRPCMFDENFLQRLFVCKHSRQTQGKQKTVWKDLQIFAYVCKRLLMFQLCSVHLFNLSLSIVGDDGVKKNLPGGEKVKSPLFTASQSHQNGIWLALPHMSRRDTLTHTHAWLFISTYFASHPFHTMDILSLWVFRCWCDDITWL